MYIPHFSPTFLKGSLIVCSLGSALLLSACGGGSDGDGDANGPTRLYPEDVMTGTITFNDARKLILQPTYVNRDYTQGFSSYSGSIQPGSDDATSGSKGDTNAEAKNFEGKNILQSSATTPGHLVFTFAEGQGHIQGQLILNLPASGMNDGARTRTGTVDSTTVLYYSADGKSSRTQLELQNTTITVTW